MHLILHCGLNKAGSTFIQDLLSYNKQILLDNNIKYPSDGDQLAGFSKGQSGNAAKLTLYISKFNKAQATKELKRFSSDVKHRTLLLSNESMYHRIIHSKQRELLKEICKELGFIKATLILVFRNIYTHAVSAYTHRVDIPGVPSLGEWVLGQKEKNANFKPGVDGYEFWDEAVLAPSLITDNFFDFYLIDH